MDGDGRAGWAGGVGIGGRWVREAFCGRHGTVLIEVVMRGAW